MDLLILGGRDSSLGLGGPSWVAAWYQESSEDYLQMLCEPWSKLTIRGLYTRNYIGFLLKGLWSKLAMRGLYSNIVGTIYDPYLKGY